jgi:hypothetical protein
MPILPFAAARPPGDVSRSPLRAPRLPALLALVCVLAACSSTSPAPTPSQTGTLGSPTPPASPTPTPLPTPRFTNEPDPALEQLIPTTLGGHAIQKPAMTGLALTPGDFGSAFGDLGHRFVSLAIAYVERPRLSLYAARIDGPPAANAALKPSLATAAEYVGIGGLHPEAWAAAVVGGHQVWTRGGDDATLPGTHLYCWTSGQYLFLLIGIDETLNRAMVTALPGEAAPTPSPTPLAAPGSSSTPPSPSPSATSS